MISIDIETMGLQKENQRCPITMICIFDKNKDEKRFFPFIQCIHPETGVIIDETLHEKMRSEVVFYLDSTDRILTYNGIFFDLPFIAHKFHVPAFQLAQWVLKTIDLYYFNKMVLNKSFKMKDLLNANKHALSKTLQCDSSTEKYATGLQAIEWAKTGNIQCLAAYCMQDTVLTWELTMLPEIIVPQYKDNTERHTLYWANSTLYVK